MLIASIIALQVLIFVGLIAMFRRIMTQNVALATQHIDELSQEYTKKEDEVNRQRDEYSKFRMPPERIAALEALPGWRWMVPKGSRMHLRG